MSTNLFGVLWHSWQFVWSHSLVNYIHILDEAADVDIGVQLLEVLEQSVEPAFRVILHHLVSAQAQSQEVIDYFGWMIAGVRRSDMRDGAGVELGVEVP